MNAKQIFLWGVVGACIPIFYKFALIDPKTALDGMPQGALLLTVFIVLYLGKTIAMLAIGGIVALWKGNGSVPDRGTLIMLGLSAPAMIGMIVTGNQIDAPASKSAYMIESGVAFASEPITDRFKPLDFKDEEPGLIDTAKQALLDSAPKNTLYLLIGERDTQDAATVFALKILEDLQDKELTKHTEGKPDLNVEVYRPYKDLKWSVTLAQRLDHDQANYLIEKLLKADFKDIRAWDLSCACYEDKKEAK